MATVTDEGYIMDDRYENVDWSKYGSAQDMYNEGSGNLGLDMSSQYDTGVLSEYQPHQFNYTPPSSLNLNVSGFGNQTIGGGTPFKNPLASTSVSGGKDTVVGQINRGGIGQNPAAMAGVVGGLGGIIQGLVGRGARRDAQIAAQEEFDDMMGQYRELDTSNIYADVENQYTNMENVYEDLTVNKQQAEFERDMFRQQQASTLSDLRGAAGGSGIAGLAQALSNQAMVQSRQAAGSIGLQERQNQILRAQEASRLQQMERAGEVQAEGMRLAGAETARSLDWRKTGTLLGMSQQQLAAANQAIAERDKALYGGIGNVIGGVAGFALGGPAGAAAGGKNKK